MKFHIYNRRYTGSKTKLNDWIESLIEKHCHDYSSLADIFAGTGAVAAHNIHKFNKLILNDILFSNQIISPYFGRGGEGGGACVARTRSGRDLVSNPC